MERRRKWGGVHGQKEGREKEARCPDGVLDRERRGLGQLDIGQKEGREEGC